MAAAEAHPGPKPVTEEDSLSDRLESVSRVAIRNTKPDQVDPNDPDQKKLIEKLNQMEVKIWGYSDNQPSFLAKLNKNNPPDSRKVLESIVHSSLVGSLQGEKPLVINPGTKRQKNSKTSNKASGDGRDDPEVKHQNQVQLQRRKILFNRTPAAQFSQRSDDTSSQRSKVASVSETQTIAAPAPREMKMIIKKTIELVADMSKSVELVFHAIRATARFLTYPTPSIPSDNHILGHVKGWLWLIYKGLLNFNPLGCEPKLLAALMKRLKGMMTKLSAQAGECSRNFEKFRDDLKVLSDSVKKEAKFLKSQSTLWSLRVDGYLKYAQELKVKKNLLVDIKEDRPFTSDWVFEPHPSKVGLSRNFFHFQWVKTKKDWEVDQFEIRSDYSTRWHPFSDFSSELQMELLFHVIDHLEAILEESTNFIKINMHLTFDFDEIKCLRFAVAEISSVKKNQRTAEYIGDMTRKLFEDMALLEEISQEFMDQLHWIENIMTPCYDAIRKPLRTLTVVEPLEISGGNVNNKLWCGCLSKSKKDFLSIYGDPMQAVFLRTPISQETVYNFFPKEHLIDHEVEILPSSARINAFGVSDGYKASLFDHVIGRDPPMKVLERLPKFRRKSPHVDPRFDICLLVQLSGQVIRSDGELDTEIYLQVFEQIRKFFRTFGTMFNFVLSELPERLENLENRLYTQLTDYYESLEKMVQHEKTSGLLASDPLTSGTRAFKRIHIAFGFFYNFLENLSDLGENEVTSYACRTAYYKAYSRYHSWFVQKTSMFGVYSIPIKKLFYSKVCPGMEIPEVDKGFKEFVSRAKEIDEHCELVFKNFEINDL